MYVLLQKAVEPRGGGRGVYEDPNKLAHMRGQGQLQSVTCL